MTTDFLDAIPLWAVFGTTVLLILVATEAGFRAGRRRSEKSYEDNEAQIISMTSAQFALLAFVLAFSFSMAANHFNERKKIVVEETNAIETAYLRTSLVAGPQGENIRALLLEYTTVRMAAGQKDKLAAVLQRSSELQAKIWHEIEQLASTGQATVYHSLLVQAVNEVFDVHQDRISAGLRNRLHATIWGALYTVLMLSMAGVGFHFGVKGARSVIPSAALALSFSMVMFLIADLDRPRSGIITSDNSSIAELYERLSQSP
jgi:hypothetical protein